MALYDSLSLDDTIDGLIPSQIRGSQPDQVTFVWTAGASLAFGPGFSIVFAGGMFTHNNKEIIAMLDANQRRGTGVHRLPETAAELTAQIKSGDELAAEGAKLAADAVAAEKAAVVLGKT